MDKHLTPSTTQTSEASSKPTTEHLTNSTPTHSKPPHPPSSSLSPTPKSREETQTGIDGKKRKKKLNKL